MHTFDGENVRFKNKSVFYELAVISTAATLCSPKGEANEFYVH